jgi:AraC-like DNA-binding protein
MQEHKSVSVLWSKTLLAAAEQQGAERSQVLQTAGVSLASVRDGQRLSLEQTLAIWRAAESLAATADFGLIMGEWVKPAHFQLFALVLLHARNLGEAFDKTIRYTRILSDGGQFRIEHEGEWAAICYEPQAENFSRHHVDAVLALLRGFSDWLACQRIPLKQAEFTHAQPPNLENYQRIFECPLLFAQPRNAVVFAAHWLHEPLALEDSELAAMHESMLEQQLQALQTPDLQQQVMHWLQQQPCLEVTRAKLASDLFLSERTLQRRLGEQDLSFQSLLDQERRQRAQHWLVQTEDSMTDIASRLGLSASSFTRACHRWFAAAPLAVRRQQAQSESSSAKTSS